MRFPEFLRSAVLLFAASASALGLVAVLGAGSVDDRGVVIFAAAWWLIATALGLWLGRRPAASRPIARLLAGAQRSTALPELEPGTILFNRLWGLALSTAVAGGLGFLFPQVPAIAAGYVLLVALMWRKQARAVAAVEGRDGLRFYVERTSAFKPTRLVRTPGFRRFEVTDRRVEPAAGVAEARAGAQRRELEPRAAEAPAPEPRLRSASSSSQERVLATCLGSTHARRAVATA